MTPGTVRIAPTAASAAASAAAGIDQEDLGLWGDCFFELLGGELKSLGFFPSDDHRHTELPNVLHVMREMRQPALERAKVLDRKSVV